MSHGFLQCWLGLILYIGFFGPERSMCLIKMIYDAVIRSFSELAADLYPILIIHNIQTILSNINICFVAIILSFLYI